MKKYVVLSVNDNQDYLYYLPMTLWSWRKIGWEPIVFYHRKDRTPEHKNSDLAGMEALQLDTPGNEIFHPFFLDSIEGYRSDTITQTSRLYGACLKSIQDDDYIMTGDIDMLALSDAWHFNPDVVTIWNHDLTDYTEFPICYLGAPKKVWREVMNIDSSDYNALLKRDLDATPNAKSLDFYKYWSVDQQIATDRFKAYKGHKDFIYRGKLSSGYARYRVDRGSWTLEHDQFIDCHMHRDLFKAFYPDPNPQHVEKWNQTITMLYKIWPQENFDWLVGYTRAFSKLAFGK